MTSRLVDGSRPSVTPSSRPTTFRLRAMSSALMLSVSSEVEAGAGPGIRPGIHDRPHQSGAGHEGGDDLAGAA